MEHGELLGWRSGPYSHKGFEHRLANQPLAFLELRRRSISRRSAAARMGRIPHEGLGPARQTTTSNRRLPLVSGLSVEVAISLALRQV